MCDSCYDQYGPKEEDSPIHQQKQVKSRAYGTEKNMSYGRTQGMMDGQSYPDSLRSLIMKPILLQCIKVPDSKMSNEMTFGLTIGLYKVCLVALDDLSSLPENK